MLVIVETLFLVPLDNHSYDLHLTPDLDAFTFVGTVHILFRVDAAKLSEQDNAAKEITLHAKELCISHAEYSSVTDDKAERTGPVVADEIVMNLKSTTVKFVFGQDIPATATKIKLTIQFTGFLNNQMYVDGYLL